MEDVELVTAKTITDYLASAFSQRRPVPKNKLLDAAMRLSVLILAEVELLVKMKQELAQLKVELLEAQDKRNVSEVEIRIEATDAYREMKKQEAFVASITEMIHTARLSARLNEFV